MNQKGFTLVEVLLASSLLGVLLTILVGMFLFGQESSLIAGERSRAVMLADEGLEAVRNIRDESFTNLTDGTYGLGLQNGKWNLSGVSDTTDGFTRTITIGTLDQNTKVATSSVTWSQQKKRNGSVSLTTYLTNWMKSAGNWASPSIASTINLTVATSGNDTANGIAVFTSGNYAYVGRANSGGREFYIFNIANPLAPQLVGQRDLNGNPNDIVVVGNYAYIASSDNGSELQIVDVSDPTAVASAGKLTTVNLTNANSGSNNADAIALATDGSYLYMVRDGGDEFIIFNLSNMTNPTIQGRTGSMSGTPTDVAVYGNYAAVSTDDDGSEFQIVDITSKSSPNVTKSLNINSGSNTADALSVALFTTEGYVGRASSSAPEFYSITTGGTLAIDGSIELLGNVNSIALNTQGDLAFLATSDSASDFVVMNISNPVSLSQTGAVNTANGLAKVAYNQDLDIAVVAGSDDAAELQIIRPQ